MRVAAEERQFSLILALLATDSGLTKSQILSMVQGYRQDFSKSGDHASLERKFERDKEDLRRLGIPVEVVDDPADPGNNQRTRYRIAQTSFRIPDDVVFTGEELSLLGLAAFAWREGSMSEESQRALLKLRAQGVAPASPIIGFTPLVRARDAAFDVLSEAVDAHVIVEFDYHKPGDPAAFRRRVSPLALINFDGRWHLVATESNQPIRKTFLLRRISGPVKRTSEAAERPRENEASDMLAELEIRNRETTAVVAVLPGTDAARRLAARSGTREISDGVLELHYVDANVLADELLIFGADVTVLEPQELIEMLVARLEILVRSHA